MTTTVITDPGCRYCRGTGWLSAEGRECACLIDVLEKKPSPPLISEPGIYLDVSEAKYHGDPCPAPSLSASTAKVLLEKSPLHAWSGHPRLGNQQTTATKAQDFGSLVHKLVLGKGRDVVVIDAPNYRKEEPRVMRDAARAAGRLPCLREEHDRATAAAEVLQERLQTDYGLELTGESEVTMVWQEQTPDGPLWCRGRADHLESHGLIWDLKTITTASTPSCARQIANLNADIQCAAYSRGLEMLRPELAGRVDFFFVFVETKPPFGVNVGRIERRWQLRGERRWVDACERFAWALKRKRWHAYGNEPVYFEAPAWLLANAEEN